MPQVITIDPLGNIETLKRKPGKGLDIAPLVKRQAIKRISLIEWSEEKQKWFIQFQLGTLRNKVLTDDLVLSLTGDELPYELREDMKGIHAGTLYWDDYDDAVAVEVHVIEQARKHGNGHRVGTATEDSIVG